MGICFRAHLNTRREGLSVDCTSPWRLVWASPWAWDTPSYKSGCVCSGGNVAFMLMAFRVLIVVVLTLNTKKKLTTGITLTAFALLLAELVAARVVTRFKHCNTDVPRQKPPSSAHVENEILREKVETFNDSKDETEPIAVTENSSSKDLRVRELLLKDEKSSSKSSKLKSKIMKKLRSYSKKKKKTTVIKEEETLSDVSSLVSKNKSDIIESARDEEKSRPPLIESKGDSMNGIVVIVIVLTGLLSGKIVAIGLTLSCLYLRLGTAKNF
ncbi:BnaC02g47530D [Brassica napus]|uniref:BnaC02g47530D protein n=2 Tax=Brassica TaxID=3705 RepID=A0A078JM47_BRANA|nr:BnaC02g47530D [Brassica napus]